MTVATLTKDLSAALDAANVTGYTLAEEGSLGLVLRIPVEANRAVMDALRQHPDLAFVQLIDTFGADVRDLVEVTYRLRSLKLNADLLVKTELPYGATLPSVSTTFVSALLAERELCELFGLALTGHPNPKRLLTTEGLPPFLRKEVAIRTKEELWTM